MKDWLIVMLSVLGFYGIIYIIKGWEDIKEKFAEHHNQVHKEEKK